jgi:hypothetical protein
MRHLISDQTELNKKRAPIIGLFAILNKDPEGPQSGAETLLKLLNTFTRAAKNFNRELRTAREKIYPLSKATVRCRRSIYATFKAKDGEVYREHWAPYPIHARPLLELIRAVKILQSISKLLGSSNDATLQSLAKKIDIKLDTPGLKPITESELINSWPQDILNPYLAVDREDFRRKSEEWRLNGFGKSYKKAYFGYWC